jgi:hypothetical protein
VGNKVKAKDMTKRDAIEVLEKMLKKGDFRKRKRRALEIAVSDLHAKVDSYQQGKQ